MGYQLLFRKIEHFEHNIDLILTYLSFYDAFIVSIKQILLRRK